jgi:hypothetical protein
MRNTTTSEPSFTSSRSESCTGPLILFPPIQVPFRLPRSSRIAWSPLTRMRACRRDTVGESNQATERRSRPRRFSPLDSWISRRFQMRR